MKLNKDINKALNQIDALDGFHHLAAARGSMHKEESELIELLKVSLRNIRDNWLNEHQDNGDEYLNDIPQHDL